MGRISQPWAVEEAHYFWGQLQRGHQSQGAPSTHWGDMEETRTEEEDLEGLPPLDPYLEGFLARAEMGNDPQQALPPEASHNNSFKLVKWHINQLETPTWWWEVSKVPGQMNVQEFARQFWASFQLPKASSHTQGVANNYLAPPALQSLDCDQFLPVSNVRFGRQDYCMRQPQMTLVYTKALQYRTEKAQLPPLGEPCQMVENVLELWQSIEPLTTFTMLRFWMMPCPCTGSRSHHPRHQSLQIPQPLRNEATAGTEGSHQRYVCGSPQHRAVKTHSHHLASKSISLPGPEDGVAARRHCQPMANTPQDLQRLWDLYMG